MAPVGLFGSMTTSARVDLRESRGVQRVRRHRHEHFAAGVDQHAQHQFDGFGCACGNQAAVRGRRETVRRQLLCDGFARRSNSWRRPVPVMAVAHRALDGGNEVRRRLEAERVGIADVQIADACTGRLDALRLHHDVPDGVAERVDAMGHRENRGARHPGNGHVATIQR